MGVDQRMADRRRLAPGLLGDRPVALLIAGEALRIIEDAAAAFDRMPQIVRQAGIGGAQIDPGGVAALGRQFERVEHRAGRRMLHVGLVGMPRDLAVAEAAYRARLAVAQVGDHADLRRVRRGPIGADGALQRPEPGAERRHLGVAQGLPAEHQDAITRPEGAERRDRLRRRRLPQREAGDFAGEGRMQRARLEVGFGFLVGGHRRSPRCIG